MTKPKHQNLFINRRRQFLSICGVGLVPCLTLEKKTLAKSVINDCQTRHLETGPFSSLSLSKKVSDCIYRLCGGVQSGHASPAPCCAYPSIVYKWGL